jgi:hypothetical protein
LGSIALIKDFRPAGEQLDRLLMVTDRGQFAVLAFDGSQGKIVTLAKVFDAILSQKHPLPSLSLSLYVVYCFV